MTPDAPETDPPQSDPTAGPPFDLGAWLQTGEQQLVLTRAQATAIHEETQRLRQSADRLRKQNAKVRKKIERVRARAADGDS